MKSLTRVLCLAACSWLGLACSSTTSTASDIPRGPDGFAVESVATVSTTVSSSGEALTVDCSEPLLVDVSPVVDSDGKMGGEFLLAPPGSCGSVTDCGWIVLTVDSSNSSCVMTDEVASASSPLRVDLPLEEPVPAAVEALATVARDKTKADKNAELSGEEKTALAALTAAEKAALNAHDCRNGTLTFHAELRDADGGPVLAETDEPLAAEFTVKVKTASTCVSVE